MFGAACSLAFAQYEPYVCPVSVYAVWELVNMVSGTLEIGYAVGQELRFCYTASRQFLGEHWERAEMISCGPLMGFTPILRRPG